MSSQRIEGAFEHAIPRLSPLNVTLKLRVKASIVPFGMRMWSIFFKELHTTMHTFIVRNL